MRRTLLIVWLLAAAAPGTAQDQKAAQAGKKDPAVKLVLLQAAAADLKNKKVKAAEVVGAAGPARQLANVRGAQGEPPVPAGAYHPQDLVIDLEGNQRLQMIAYFREPLPKGTKLSKLRPWGAFTAESGKEVLQLAVLEAEVLP